MSILQTVILAVPPFLIVIRNIIQYHQFHLAAGIGTYLRNQKQNYDYISLVTILIIIDYRGINMEYDIKVHTWWEHRIRKITISSGENKIGIWFAHFGELDLEDKKTQNIFAGIMQGIFGEPVETPSVHLSIIKKNKKYMRRIHNTKELMDSFKLAFGA